MVRAPVGVPGIIVVVLLLVTLLNTNFPSNALDLPKMMVPDVVLAVNSALPPVFWMLKALAESLPEFLKLSVAPENVCEALSLAKLESLLKLAEEICEPLI